MSNILSSFRNITILSKIEPKYSLKCDLRLKLPNNLSLSKLEINFLMVKFSINFYIAKHLLINYYINLKNKS